MAAFDTFPKDVQEFTEELDRFLHSETIGILKDVFQKIERNFDVRRLNIALGFLACLTIFFLVSDGAHFLCNFIGFVYPACVIIKSVEQGFVQLDNKKWLTYWVIYNAFSFVENFLPTGASFWSVYSLVKCIILVLCFLPVPWNGSKKLYNGIILPFLQSHHTTITERAEQSWERINKGAVGFVLVYFTYMWGFRFLGDILGFVYPAYISMVSLMNDSEMDKKCWMTYWVIFSSCTLLEYIISAIPLYYPLKFILLGIFMLEPLVQSSLCYYGHGLILLYKPINSAKRLCHTIAQFFLTSDEASQNTRVNQVNRFTPGIQSLRNIALKKTQDTLIKAQLMVDPEDVNLQMSSPMVQAVLEMDVDVELVKKAIRLKLAVDGHNFRSSEGLLEAVFNLTISSNGVEEGSSVDYVEYPDGYKSLLHIPNSIINGRNSQDPLEVIEENRQLKDQRMCKICMTEEVEIVFVPCGHLVCCYKCAEVMTTCPICRKDIDRSLRAYMS